MKKLIAAVLCALSLSAVAATETVKFSHNGIETWGRSYFSCDTVEAQTERALKALGATQINVDCTGGIRPGQMWLPVSVTASFEVAALQGNETAVTKTIKSRPGQESCSMNVLIMKSVLPKFSNVTVLEKRDRCSSPNTRWSYTVSILQ